MAKRFTHYIGESEQGGIVEILIAEDGLSEDPEDYFRRGWKNMEKQGVIEMSGEAEHMLGDHYEYTI